VGNYGDFAYVDDVLAMAHFYPTVVVYNEQGWHRETPATQGDVIFHDASLYDVSLTAPADLTLAATGSTLERVANADGTATWRLVGGPMRDFNVAASKRYQSASQKAGDVTVTSYFLPEQTAGGQKALDWASQALQAYETAFGPYPYTELDVVETGTTAGGIEYPGMVVIADRLYDDSNRSDFFESATVHEVAHQWWYNVVGNDQVNDPWLDEALTQFSTYFYYDQAYGKQGTQGLLDSLRARWSRVNYAEKPIGLPVSEYQDQEYSAIVYGRGPLFLFALRDQIGADKMAELLRRYYAEYSWKIATPNEFRRLAEEVSGQDIGDLWTKWVTP
jgi:aminopeptidase N